jgi:hypothetical protein
MTANDKRIPSDRPGKLGQEPRSSSKAQATSKAAGGDFSDNAPGLVAPSKLNLGDRGMVDDVTGGGGELNFDDDEIYSGRGNGARQGGTASAAGADSAPLGPPAEILSATNLPSDRSLGDNAAD